MPRTNRPRCVVCGSGMIRNGSTTAGHPRWRCKDCGASTTRRRRDQAPAQDDPTPGQVEDFTMFLAWAAGRCSQAEAAGGSDRAFRRRTAWCRRHPSPQAAGYWRGALPGVRRRGVAGPQVGAAGSPQPHARDRLAVGRVRELRRLRRAAGAYRPARPGRHRRGRRRPKSATQPVARHSHPAVPDPRPPRAPSAT